MEPITDVPDEIIEEFREYLNRQARVIKALAPVENVSFPELLKVIGATRKDYRRFEAGEVDLTGHERLVVGRCLGIHPEIIMDLGVPCSEYDFKRHEKWLNTRSKWKKNG